ncbi:NAD-dependent epimerase/dehydratase family protein [Sedimenticola hydrogenitrophicus]|uniref:NAD-dependent epimerase/dehydratase family protein n=1 Tax=Sedimenticola hydrogenitrophicus TaxID=2967975 RepID=UPI0023B14719|nr:NAD(P)-dependent oxidoreductase [Sedimenticola hydrogenitrophicus]
MTKTVLLTGATGFVGRQVLKALEGQAVKLRLVVREGHEYRIEPMKQIESQVVSPDIFTEPMTWWQEVCNGIDTVVHVAWYAEPGHYLQSPRNLDCLSGTLTLAKACLDSGVRRFVGVGTCFEYDLSQGYLSVDTPLKPVTPYAATKAAVFLSLSQYFAVTDVEFAWCRLFYLYGEGEDERRLVPYLKAKLSKGETAELTSGSQLRDFMDVQEAGRMITDIALSHRQGAINVCSGKGTTVRELAEQIADDYGRRDLLRFGARRDNLIDPPCVVGIKAGVES